MLGDEFTGDMVRLRAGARERGHDNAIGDLKSSDLERLEKGGVVHSGISKDGQIERDYFEARRVVIKSRRPARAVMARMPIRAAMPYPASRMRT